MKMGMTTRAAVSPQPKTLDEKARTVRAVIATSQPVKILDYERGIIDEVLIPSGFQAAKESLPLLDSHSRGSVNNILGSVSDFVANESNVMATIRFATTPDGQAAFDLVREGHLTDLSVSYVVEKYEFLDDGESRSYNARDYTGPLKISHEWVTKEVSLTPIGADSAAEIRSEHKQEVTKMKPEEIKKVERQRAADVVEACRLAMQPDKAADYLAGEKSVDEIRAELLRNLPEPQTVAGRVEMGADEVDKFKRAATDGLLIRSGISPEKPADGATDLSGYTMVELARECLRKQNLSTRGSALEMVGRSLTTSDFPYILADSANKSLFAGWDTAPETWAQWCGTGSVSNFLTHYSVRPSELDDLDLIPEDGEYTYSDRSEARESYSIATYGKMFRLSRQTIINDDLAALTDIPRAHGEAAARKVGDLAYSVLTTNGNMGDGVALFNSAHSNYVASGSGGAPGTATLAAGIKAMKLQEDLQGLRKLNIQPKFFIGPVALEGASEVFFRSDRLAGSTDGYAPVNIYSGNYFSRVYDPRLDDHLATGWYLAGPKGKTVIVYFLNGVQRPFLDRQDGWNSDGVEWKVRLDCGAGAIDYRALYYNYGA